MEKSLCKIICGAPTTLAGKGLMMMMMIMMMTPEMPGETGRRTEDFGGEGFSTAVLKVLEGCVIDLFIQLYTGTLRIVSVVDAPFNRYLQG